LASAKRISSSAADPDSKLALASPDEDKNGPQTKNSYLWVSMLIILGGGPLALELPPPDFSSASITLPNKSCLTKDFGCFNTLTGNYECKKQCCGSMTFWCGSRSADPFLLLMDMYMDPDPDSDLDSVIFVIDHQDANKNLIFLLQSFLLITF
jgi:hypothetical protein